MGIIGVLGFGPFIGFGVYFLIKKSKESDDDKAKKLLKKGIFLIVLPFILISFALISIVVVNIIEALYVNQ